MVMEMGGDDWDAAELEWIGDIPTLYNCDY